MQEHLQEHTYTKHNYFSPWKWEEMCSKLLTACFLFSHCKLSIAPRCLQWVYTTRPETLLEIKYSSLPSNMQDNYMQWNLNLLVTDCYDDIKKYIHTFLSSLNTPQPCHYLIMHVISECFQAGVTCERCWLDMQLKKKWWYIAEKETILHSWDLHYISQFQPCEPPILIQSFVPHPLMHGHSQAAVLWPLRTCGLRLAKIKVYYIIKLDHHWPKQTAALEQCWAAQKAVTPPFLTGKQ